MSTEDSASHGAARQPEEADAASAEGIPEPGTAPGAEAAPEAEPRPGAEAAPEAESAPGAGAGAGVTPEVAAAAPEDAPEATESGAPDVPENASPSAPSAPEKPGPSAAPDQGEDEADGASVDAAAPSLVRPYADLPAQTVEPPAVPNTSAFDALDEADAGDEAGGGGAGRRPAMGRRPVLTGAVLTGVLLLVLAAVLHQAGGWPFGQSGDPAPRAGARLPAAPESRAPETDAPSGKKEKKDEKPGPASSSPEAPDPAESESGDGAKDEGHGADGNRPPSGPQTPAPGGGGDSGCEASWHVDSQWEDFTATVRVTNTTSRPADDWVVSWTWPDGKRFRKTWNADIEQSGNAVTARKISTNQPIAPSGEVTFGLEATGSGSPAPSLTCRVL